MQKSGTLTVPPTGNMPEIPDGSVPYFCLRGPEFRVMPPPTAQLNTQFLTTLPEMVRDMDGLKEGPARVYLTALQNSLNAFLEGLHFRSPAWRFAKKEVGVIKSYPHGLPNSGVVGKHRAALKLPRLDFDESSLLASPFVQAAILDPGMDDTDLSPSSANIACLPSALTAIGDKVPLMDNGVATKCITNASC